MDETSALKLVQRCWCAGPSAIRQVCCPPQRCGSRGCDVEQRGWDPRPCAVRWRPVHGSFASPRVCSLGVPCGTRSGMTGSAWDRRAARAGDGRDIKRRLCPMLGRCAAAMHVKSHCRSNQHGQIPGEIRWRVKWGRRGRQGRGEVWDWVGGEAAVDALLAALRRSRCCTLD